MEKKQNTVQIDLFNKVLPEKINTIQYRGNKSQVLDFVIPHFKGATTILDLMAGSQSIGSYYKKYAKILSNDVQYYSYVLGKAYVENNQYKTLNLIPLKDITPHPEYNLFFKYYADKYFSISQAKEIDAIRAKIEKIKSEDDILSYCYLACLLKTLDLVSRTAGHFWGFIEKDSPKAKARDKKSVYKQFSKICRNFKVNLSSFKHKCFNLTAIELLKKIEKVDIIYLDPPYNRRQYSDYYHLLEMCARYEGELEDNSVTLLPKERFKSKFCHRGKVHNAFKDVLDLAKDLVDQKIIISYTNQGFLSIEELNEIFREYSGKVEIYEKKIQYTKQKTSFRTEIEKELLFILNF